MKRMEFIIAICIILITTSLHAQSIAPTQLKEARLSVYKWVDLYKQYVHISNEHYTRTGYKRLFINDTVWVVNDYLPKTDGNPINLADYVDIMSFEDNYYVLNTKIKNVYVVSEDIHHNAYVCNLSIVKEVKYIGKDETFYYPEKVYTAHLSLEYDFATREIKCKGINSSDSLYVDCVFHTNQDSITNKYIEFKDTAQLLIREKGMPVIINKSLHHEPFDGKMIDLKYDTAKNALSVYGNFYGLIFITSKVSSMVQNMKESHGFSMQFGVKYYRQFYYKDMNRFGLEVDINYSSTANKISGQSEYEYNSVDLDGGHYTRQIHINHYLEKIERHSVGGQISFKYDRFLTNKLSLFTRIGVGCSYDIKQESDVETHLNIAGYYDWLFGVTLDQNGIYDFGNFESRYFNNNVSMGPLNISILTGLGLQYFITSRLSFEFGIDYKGVIFNNRVFNDSPFFESLETHNSVTYLYNKICTHNVGATLQLNYNF